MYARLSSRRMSSMDDQPLGTAYESRGCVSAAMSSDGSAASSRAMTTFCLLPPDSDSAGVRIDVVELAHRCVAVRRVAPGVPPEQEAFQGCVALDFANGQAIALSGSNQQSAAFDASNDRVVMCSVGGASTVVGVALRCGFANPSRFAQDYREAFGESPTETLRRRRIPSP